MSWPNFAAFQEPHPPRRYVDLQCLTNRRSRSIGFTAPSPSFWHYSLDPDVFRRPASQAIYTPPDLDTTRGLTLALEDFLFLFFIGYPNSSRALFGCSKTTSHGVFLPFDALTRGIHFQARLRSGAVNSLAQPSFVAGFQARFVPPSSFSATVTVSSSSSRVAFFIHSRPWGSVARFPLLPLIHHHPSRADPSQRRRFETSEKLAPAQRGGGYPSEILPALTPPHFTSSLAKVRNAKAFHPLCLLLVLRTDEQRHRSVHRGELSGPGSPRQLLASIGHRRAHAFYHVTALAFRVTPVFPLKQRTAPAHQPTPA